MNTTKPTPTRIRRWLKWPLRRWRFVASGLIATGLIACGPVSSCAPTPAPTVPFVPQPIILPYTPGTQAPAPSGTQAPEPPVPPVFPIPPILPPPPSSQPSCNVEPYWGSLTGHTVCIAQDQIDEWNTAALDNPNAWVNVYHGSVDNGIHIQVAGLDFGTNGTYVSRDYRIALDTACNPRHLPDWRKGYDRWILRSQIPQSIFNKYFVPETPYTGWSFTIPGGTEVQITNDIQVAFFNYGINSWDENLLPAPQLSPTNPLTGPDGLYSEINGGCGLGYYTLPYAQPPGV